MISVLISALEMLDFSSFSSWRFPRTGVWKKGKKGNGRKRKSNYLYDSMISIPNHYLIFSFLLSKLKSLKISLPRTNFPFFFLDNPRIIERSSMRRRERGTSLLAGNRVAVGPGRRRLRWSSALASRFLAALFAKGGERFLVGHFIGTEWKRVCRRRLRSQPPASRVGRR